MKNKILALAVLSATMSPAHAADLKLQVDAREVQRKHVHSELTLAVQGGGPLTLVFPKWIPGEHSPSGPLDTMIGLVIRANGMALAWQRDPYDMYALSVNVPSGVGQLDISLDSGLPIEGGVFGTGPTSSAQLAVLPLNLFVLLPKGRDAATISSEASVLAPPGWRISCALATHAAADGSVMLEGATLDRLIDSPVQMGEHLLSIDLPGSAPYPELRHTLSITADSAAALTVPDGFAAAYGRLVAQAGALFGTRMYRHYTWIVSLSDHVAHFGLEHHESSDDRYYENAITDAGRREMLAELLAHEYVHSWNGKYRRPAGLLSPDYDRPMDGSLLWVYEGLTQFWGTVLPVRAGLYGPDSYREMLAAVAGEYDNQPGDRWPIPPWRRNCSTAASRGNRAGAGSTSTMPRICCGSMSIRSCARVAAGVPRSMTSCGASTRGAEARPRSRPTWRRTSTRRSPPSPPATGAGSFAATSTRSVRRRFSRGSRARAGSSSIPPRPTPTSRGRRTHARESSAAGRSGSRSTTRL